ncbi:C40 family peptidase [Nocardia brasiliensis]|uniref:C40 family peptidase n=1 Tax=Nocardia brasiliensis TaxID=37326 RepID=UPI003D9382FB
MSPALSGDVAAVLRAFHRLYGDGVPEVHDAGAARTAADGQGFAGTAAAGYAQARAMQTAVAESQAGRDNAVRQAAGRAGDGTVTGRNRIGGQIADFESRVKAIAAVGDTRFSGPALLSAAQVALVNATRQVNSDLATAQAVAAQIVPPPVPSPTARRNSVPPKRRRGRGRGRGTPYNNGGGRPARRSRTPHDESAGGAAVRIASSLIGTPYVWDGDGSVDGGYDCSSLVRHAIAEATGDQVMLPRTTYDQIHSGQRVELWEARAGDLVFPADSFGYNGPEHVQLADGRGGVIESPFPGAAIRWAPMPTNATVVRVLFPRE